MSPNQVRAFTVFARAGYTARAVVYSLIGAFTVYAAFWGGQPKNSEGAVRTVLDGPAGDVLAIALMLGLIGYAGWRCVQAIFDTDDHGTDPRGLAVRGGLLASATSYGLLLVYTGSRWIGGSGGGGGGGAADAVVAFIGNRISAAILAIIFAIVAFAHIRKAWVGGYEKHLAASDSAMKIIHPIARTGLVARGLVFVILAVLLGWRTWTAQGTSGDPPGLTDALAVLRDLPFGPWLLGGMGVGLVCFALYSLIEAIFRRINVEDA